jgi:hypothetical protein
MTLMKVTTQMMKGNKEMEFNDTGEIDQIDES